MNARQKMKCLKKQINRIESDNNLMRKIIADAPAMQELYDLYNKPLNVKHTTMQFQEFRAKRMIPVYMVDVNGVIEYTKRALAEDLFEEIKDNITYAVDHETPTITASIFIGME